MPDNGGLAPTFAYHKGKISPKAGIIKSLQIPYSSNTNREYRHALLLYLIWYKRTNDKSPYSSKTSALVGYVQDTSTTDIITSNINGSTMTGGSR